MGLDDCLKLVSDFDAQDLESLDARLAQFGRSKSGVALAAPRGMRAMSVASAGVLLCMRLRCATA